jgi:hypothetical protein
MKTAKPVKCGSKPKTLIWADTGEPVKGGNLTEGEAFEVELATGKTKRVKDKTP